MIFPAAPYGIFARSCVAMAKDAKSTFQIVDDEGCPVDPSIFPAFTPDGNALQSVYEAFRFTESYGVIFQCNVKYCLGPCEPVRVVWLFLWRTQCSVIWFLCFSGGLRVGTRLFGVLGQKEEVREQRNGWGEGRRHDAESGNFGARFWRR